MIFAFFHFVFKTHSLIFLFLFLVTPIVIFDDLMILNKYRCLKSQLREIIIKLSFVLQFVRIVLNYNVGHNILQKQLELKKSPLWPPNQGLLVFSSFYPTLNWGKGGGGLGMSCTVKTWKRVLPIYFVLQHCRHFCFFLIFKIGNGIFKFFFKRYFILSFTCLHVYVFLFSIYFVLFFFNFLFFYVTTLSLEFVTSVEKHCFSFILFHSSIYFFEWIEHWIYSY